MTTVTRRSLLTWGVAVAGGLLVKPAAAARRYGPLTPDAHRHLCQQGVHLHVFHQGQEVTRRCTFADDTGQGTATLLLHDAKGRPIWDPRTLEATQEIVHGVTFREGAPFT